jgi:hypothetical protein
MVRVLIITGPIFLLRNPFSGFRHRLNNFEMSVDLIGHRECVLDL